MNKMSKTAVAAAALAAGALAWAPSAHASEGYVVTVGSVTVTEGAAPTASVPLSLSQVAPDGGLCLKVVLGHEGDSAREDNDFVAQSGQSVTFASGSSSAIVQVPIVDDLEAEVEQSFTVAVAQVDCVGTSAVVGPVDTTSTGHVTVLDNDALPQTGTSTGLAWVGLGALGLGALGLVGSRRRQRTA